MLKNQYRPGISDDDAKNLIKKHCPEVTDVEEFEELWEAVVEASKCKTISQALATLSDRGSGIVLEIHSLNPWTPSPDEATILKAFTPNYINAILLTAVSKNVFDDKGDVSEELLRHAEKVCEEINKQSQKEFDASRRGA